MCMNFEPNQALLDRVIVPNMGLGHAICMVECDEEIWVHKLACIINSKTMNVYNNFMLF